MVLETRALLTEFREEAQLQRGRLTVGASPSVASSYLPAVIGDYRRRWPDIEIALIDDFYGQALDRLQNGQVDLVVAPLASGAEAYICEPLLDDVFKLAVPDHHRLASRDEVALADFADEPQITMPPESAAWATLRSAFAKAGQDLTPAYMTRFSLTLVSMVREGLGVGLVSGLLSRTLDMRGVTLLPVADADLTRHIGIVRARDRAPNPASDAFRELLFKHAKTLQ
jgi:DNA-binding transcriptional LysR family regulator